MSRDLLIEIGCEDLPARYVMPLAEALRAGVVGGLAKRGVAAGAAQVFATPRRIAVLVAAVADEQATQSVDLTGPALNVALKDGNPTPAALGFAKKCGVEFAALGQKDGKLHYARTEPGKPTAELIPVIFEDTLKSMDELVPKRMRWGDGNETFVRPVSWLVCLLGEAVVPLARFGLHSGRLTYGHRFHAPGAISLSAPADYEAALKAAYVWAEVSSRKSEIKRQIEAEAAKLDGHARITEDLLDEVTALVEWPVVIAGRMEQRFMELPPEVIVATVETNQRYFTVFEDAARTRLKPVFITIANIESRDVSQIIEGNERVVRPRLSDAMFFWEQDKKQPFASYRSRLADATYQKELGTVDARVDRIQMIAQHIAGAIDADRDAVSGAASLCKNDLVAKMVFEFPELQGLMGGYYARASGASGVIAKAIGEHYLPTQQGTPIPSTREGQVLALADKLDALAGIFAIGQKPTASKDPYALRRAANGVLRICIEGELPLDVATLLSNALDSQPTGKKDAATLAELVEFVMERLRALLVGGSITTEMFEAVKATGCTQPLDSARRIEALKGFVTLPASTNLAAAHKRIRNILKQAGDVGIAIDAKLFESDAEHALFAAMNTLDLEGDYAAQLTQLATLREPVDAFFTAVMVNADDPAVRSNRLALLARLDKLCRSVADISLLPG
ncbi:MAG: glycine--tRNA ligase subunit beta [Stagnimonas sp.]|nr:glycine--tRNA ligase subunit beta [Stagnimonas sp.]